MKTMRPFLQMTLVAMTICLLTAVTYAGNITIVTESQSTIVETDTVNVESDISTATLSCADTQIVSQSGEMAIPSKIIKVLLPPDADLSTVECVVQSADYEQVKGTLEVRPVPPMGTRINGVNKIVWPKGKKIANGKDVAIYKADAVWPRKGAQIVSAGKLRNFKIVELAVPLAACNPARKNLWLLTDAVVRIDFDRADEIEPVDTLGQERAKKMVANFGQYADEYNVAPAAKGMSSTGYTILTTSAIQSASTKLADFVSHKQAMGFDVQVVTESEWGGGKGASAARNILSWLQNNYITDDIKYVLLIGNPNTRNGDVAMKKEAGNATDFYYSDLTGDDRIWEVIVGRIPYYGVPADLNHILQKTMDYENEVDQLWRKNVLLPMVPYDADTPSYQCGEQIKYNLLEPEAIPSIRIYNSTYGLNPPPEYLRSQMYPATCWANNTFGMVTWLTHGWDSYASGVINTGDVPSLNDAYPSTVFMGSCGNALPDITTNLTYMILTNGSIGAIGATNYSYYLVGQSNYTNTTSNGGFAYQFSKRIVERQSCGEALANLKEYLVPGIWENFLVFTLYGDPSVVVLTIDPDVTPPTPDPMTWAAVPYATSDSSISMTATTATDIENGVEYKFTCTTGGGNDSGWQTGTSYEDTGLTPETQYTYTVKARDTSGNHNQTAASTAESATTNADVTAPTPDPMTFAVLPAASGEVNFGADEDAYVKEQTGEGTNNADLRVRGDGTGQHIDSYVKFTVSGVGTVTSAKLKLYSDNVNMNVDVYTAASNSWDESTLTWNNAPGTTGGSLDNVSVTTGWTEFDVTAALTGDGTYSFVLSGDVNSSSRDFSSSEGANPPVLTISTPGGSDTNIVMTATTATDLSGVEYYFDETSLNPGGSDSGWQDSTVYVDTDLTPETQYTYTVTARDKSVAQNETAVSTAESATTEPSGGDTTPPTPDPMTWATVPYATGQTSIAMVATTATDTSGVEYYFTCTAGGGNDSDWQDSPSYEDTGLTPDTTYTYTVKARDKSANQNETAASTAESATTDPGGCTATDMHIEAVVCSEVSCGGPNRNGVATVTIYDDCGDPVSGALVDVTFTGDISETVYDVATNSSGVAVVTSTACVKRPSFTATVIDVTDTLPYDSNDDVTDNCSG